MSGQPRAGFVDWTDPELRAAAAETGPDVDAALALARRLSPTAAEPGHRSWNYLRTLGSVGAGDLTVARVVEPHLDALAILGQASGTGQAYLPPEGSTWGVYAAHAPGSHLRAVRAGTGWRLHGTKPWCSLADQLSHAVVTAHDETVDDGGDGGAGGDDAGDGIERRRAFVVELAAAGVQHPEAPWAARGLPHVRSTAVDFDDVPATPVGPPGWYLERPGFAWGGIGVAAVWLGAACALAEAVLVRARSRTPDQIAHLHLGRLDAALRAAELALRDAADRMDRVGGDAAHAGTAAPAGAQTQALLAARCRDAAALAAETALTEVARALGPAPLATDEAHAARVADLTLYVRQHHGERDLARTGALLVGGPG
ncbi:acyl-CoA dehydrogenase [Serinicoccus sp. LYQ131]|uniref:acyl-CoA dehydrogenase n=1 Tax=Serinicoccus sp. LYQ131 TaxID=3378797 RepID=UPI00385308D0